MLDELANRLEKEMFSKIPCTAKQDQIKIRIADYKSLLDPAKNTLYPDYMLPHFRSSILKLIELYEAGIIDGTKSTFVCQGEVISVKRWEDAPPYTLEDGPAVYQLVSTVFPPMAADGFHRINARAPLKGLPQRAITRRMIFDTGSSIQSPQHNWIR